MNYTDKDLNEFKSLERDGNSVNIQGNIHFFMLGWVKGTVDGSGFAKLTESGQEIIQSPLRMV
jgi:hypothetical protein